MDKKKIISFALWGKEPFYLDGAINNVILYKKYLPDWTCRFYHDDTVPIGIIEVLEHNSAELIECEQTKDVLGMFWRFQPMWDNTVERFIVRDTDSLPSEREVFAINEWITSGKPFHIIRDNKAHGASILGGMWGAVQGCIPNFKQLMDGFLSKVKPTSSQHSKRLYHGSDQQFLHSLIWPLIWDSDRHIAHVRRDEPGLIVTGDEVFLPVITDDHFIGMPCSLIDDKVVRVESHLLDCNKKENQYTKICLMLPTYKRVPYIQQFVQSVFDTVDNVNNICLCFCVNKNDIATIDFIKENFPDAEIIIEETRQPNLALYFNMMYKQTKCNLDNTIISMLGDDMEFITKGWDTVILNEINQADGKIIIYCDDDNTAHDKCAVNMFITKKIVDATDKPYMCEIFHADGIDAVWTLTGKMANVIKYLPDVHIKHNHMSNIPPDMRDETFNRLEPIRKDAMQYMNRYAIAYSVLCARNIIEKGIGQWNILK